MLYFFLSIYLVEYIILLSLIISIKRRRTKYSRIFVPVTVLALLQLFFSMTVFYSRSSIFSPVFTYFARDFVYSTVCLCSDIILLATARFVTKSVKNDTKPLRFALTFFILFTVVDGVVLYTNIFHHRAFGWEVMPLWQSPQAIFTFMPSAKPLILVHRCFNTLLMLISVISLLLKCTSIPIIYSGRYLLLAFGLFISATVSFAYNYIPGFPFYFPVHILIFDMVPWLLFWYTTSYRPTFTLAYIRKMAFDKLRSPVVLFDVEDLLVDFNSDAANLFALDSSLINHLSISEFLHRSIDNQMRQRTTSTVEEISLTDASGSEQIYNLDYTKLTDPYGKNYGTLLLFHNITELKKLYNTMEKTAMTDMLTGLASKTLLQKKITEINLYRKFPYCAAVCNINGLNLISEGFGDDAGKAALMHVADVLKSQLRSSDFAAYEDGNMVVLMPDTHAEEAKKVLARISKSLKDDRTFSFMLSFEFGVAERSSQDSDMQLTLSQAQAAMLKQKLLNSNYTQESIVEALQKTLRESSYETEQHSVRVENLSLAIAKNLKLPKSQYQDLKLLALFHDIGKISVPKELLEKPAKLTPEEKQIMSMHTINGYKIANASKELSPVARGILCHHEKWDGSGYPNGYKEEQIPYLARIVTVADAFDVMTHDRPYKTAYSVERSVAEIRSQVGRQFDPSVVKAFLLLKHEDFI